MNINIMGAGPADLIPELKDYNGTGDKWVGVDRGTTELLSREIYPVCAFGDFDSVTGEEFAQIEEKRFTIKKYQPEKDETDMELALNWALEQEPGIIRIFGATGGRLDHFLANAQLLERYSASGQNTDIRIIDKRNLLFVRRPGCYEIIKDSGKKYVSFLPAADDVAGLTLSGFKYPLENGYLPKGSTLCISNELIGETGSFSFTEGILIIIRSND